MAGNNNLWFHKYPFTSFHELDLSFLLDTVDSLEGRIKDVEDRLTLVESDIVSLKERMDTAEGRIDTAEDDIDSLEGRMSTAEDDIDSLEGRASALEQSDIMDAVMIKQVDNVTPDATKVRINFVKDTYVDGAKTAGTDLADIPSATTTNAGVMLPAEKQKLNAFTVDGSGNVEFGGTVSGSAPSANNDYATKQYVDNIAITGSASLTHVNITPTSEYGTLQYISAGQSSFKLYRYGAIRLLTFNFYMNPSDQSTDIPKGGNVAVVALDNGDLPPVNTISGFAESTDHVHFKTIVNHSASGVYIQNWSDAIIPAGTGISNTNGALVWVVE